VTANADTAAAKSNDVNGRGCKINTKAETDEETSKSADMQEKAATTGEEELMLIRKNQHQRMRSLSLASNASKNAVHEDSGEQSVISSALSFAGSNEERNDDGYFRLRIWDPDLFLPAFDTAK